MKDFPYQYAILRYIHDPVTQEFLNVGIVIYSKEARYLKGRINTRYSRLSKAFPEINGAHYRRIISYIQRSLSYIYSSFSQSNLFDELPTKIETILDQVLPPDDSSLVFGGYGGGLAANLDTELDRLYARMVERYEEKGRSESRDDQEVWQVYSQELDRTKVTLHLSAVELGTASYSYKFDHAWKNERWHPIEPVSFDLKEETYIKEKAIRWIGRAIMLADSDDIGTLYFLLGSPHRHELQGAYRRATSNLREKTSSKLDVQIIEEDEAPEFSIRLAKLIEEHS
jgi:hypothetical protein